MHVDRNDGRGARRRCVGGRRLRRLSVMASTIARSRTPGAAAIQKCTGSGCRIVGEIRRSCAALAVDAKQPCGSFGWALNSHLGKAENASLRRCYEFGGRDCVVRAWACDEKG